MGNRTGRKTIASTETKAAVLKVHKGNPDLTAPQIAEKFIGVSARQVRYWIGQAKSKERANA